MATIEWRKNFRFDLLVLCDQLSDSVAHKNVHFRAVPVSSSRILALSPAVFQTGHLYGRTGILNALFVDRTERFYLKFRRAFAEHSFLSSMEYTPRNKFVKAKNFSPFRTYVRATSYFEKSA